MAKQDEYVRYTIRVPAALYGQIQEAAADKSINAEIIERLRKSFDFGARVAEKWQNAPGEEPLLNVADDAVLRAIDSTVREAIEEGLKRHKVERPSDDLTALLDFYEAEKGRIEREVPKNKQAKSIADLIDTLKRAAKFFDVDWKGPDAKSSL